MLPVLWTDEADSDLAEIVAYVGSINPVTATRLWGLILDSTLLLPEHPYLFKASEKMPGCREIVVHPNYVVFYQVAVDHIKVLRVIHSRRHFP